MQPDNGFDVNDAAQIAVLTSQQLMEWWALTHQQTIPVNPNTPIYSGPTPGGGRLTLPSNTLIVLALGIVAVVLLVK
jgi:hypothetical protein